MLIETTEIDQLPTKQLVKTCQRINKYLDKEKPEKAKKEVSKLEEALQNPEEAVPASYVLSVIAEKDPELLDGVDVLEELLESENEKIFLNGIVGMGFYILYELYNDEVDQKRVSSFIANVRHPKADVREMVVMILEQFPPDSFYLITQEALSLLEQLREESQEDLRRAILKFLNQMITENIHYSEKIESVYLQLLEEPLPKETVEAVATGLREINPNLPHEFAEQREIIDLQSERPPIVKIHDLTQIQHELNLTEEEVKDKYMELRDEGLLSGFFYLRGSKKQFVEYEEAQMVRFLEKGKKKVDDLLGLFGVNEQQLNILVKTLVKERLLRGFLSKLYFYSHENILENMLKQFNQTGEILVEDFTSYLNEKYVMSILKQLANSSKTEGFFDRKQTRYISLNRILKEIEAKASKTTAVDLAEYKALFHTPDYYKIKEACTKRLFTEYHAGPVFLTHVGKIRLEQALVDAGKIGFADVEKINETLEVPLPIVKQIARTWFEKKNGLWDASDTKFYFFRYLEVEIEKINKDIKSPVDRAEALKDLSSHLGISLENLNARLKAKQDQVGAKILRHDSVDIVEYMDMLDMKRSEFIHFIDTLDRPYLQLDNKVIFSPKKIADVTTKIKNDVIRDARRSRTLELTALQKKYKLKSTVFGDIVRSLVEEGKIEGFWIHGDVFLTRFGIEQALIDLKRKDRFWIDDIIEGHELSNEELAFVEEVLQDLIDHGRIEGTYDPEDRSFFTQDAKVKMDKEKTLEGLKELQESILAQLDDAFGRIAMLLFEEEGMNPQTIQIIEDFIDETVKQSIEWEREINTFVFRRSRFVQDLKEDEDVRFYVDQFQNRKNLFWELENRIPEILALKKWLKINPENEEKEAELARLYRHFGFM